MNITVVPTRSLLVSFMWRWDGNGDGAARRALHVVWYYNYTWYFIWWRSRD